MATIEKRETKSAKTFYRCKVRRRNQPLLTATFRLKTEAQRWCAEKEAEALSGRHFSFAESRFRNLSEAIARYSSDILRELKDPTGRITHLAWFEKNIGNLILGDITPSILDRCREDLKRESIVNRKSKALRTNATVNRYFASLKAMFNVAVRQWQWLNKNPCDNLKPLKEPRGRCSFLSHTELLNLLQATKRLKKYPEMGPIILLALTTGMRRREIAGLRWTNIDLQKERIIICDAKNGEQRSAPLLDPALSAFKEWSHVKPIDPDTYVFPSRGKMGNKKPFDPDHAWNLIRTDAQLTDF